MHLAGADIWFLDSILNGAFERREGEAKLKGRRPRRPSSPTGTSTFPAKLEQVLALPDHKFTEMIDFFGMKNPAIVYLNFALVHGVHHRGQLSGYLRPMGGKVPSIYGGSADETGRDRE